MIHPTKFQGNPLKIPGGRASYLNRTASGVDDDGEHHSFTTIANLHGTIRAKWSLLLYAPFYTLTDTFQQTLFYLDHTCIHLSLSDLGPCAAPHAIYAIDNPTRPSNTATPLIIRAYCKVLQTNFARWRCRPQPLQAPPPAFLKSTYVCPTL